jgi:hypothetical protein
MAEGLTGLNGAVLIGGVRVASIRQWTWTRESTTVDVGGFGDVYEQTRVTRKRGTGSFTGVWAKNDTVGQGATEDAYEAATQIALGLQIESGKVYTVQAFLSQLEVGAQYDGATTFNSNFVQFGAPTSLADHS